MPYELKKVKGGYKVQSESGRFLSKKPLTETRAKKQKIAATLTSLKIGDITRK